MAVFSIIVNKRSNNTILSVPIQKLRNKCETTFEIEVFGNVGEPFTLEFENPPAGQYDEYYNALLLDNNGAFIEITSPHQFIHSGSAKLLAKVRNSLLIGEEVTLTITATNNNIPAFETVVVSRESNGNIC